MLSSSFVSVSCCLYAEVKCKKETLLTGGGGGHGDQESESWKEVLEACEASIALHSEVTLSYNYMERGINLDRLSCIC